MRDCPVRVQTDDCGIQRKRPTGRAIELGRSFVVPYDYDLHVRFGKTGDGESVGRCKNAVLCGDAGIEFQRALGVLPIVRLVRVAVEAEQRDCSCRIAGGSGGILKRFSPRS